MNTNECPPPKPDGLQVATQEARAITAGLFRAFSVPQDIRDEFVEVLARKFLTIEHDTYHALRENGLYSLTREEGWCDHELAVLRDLAKEKDLSESRLLLQALRTYQSVNNPVMMPIGGWRGE